MECFKKKIDDSHMHYSFPCIVPTPRILPAKIRRIYIKLFFPFCVLCVDKKSFQKFDASSENSQCFCLRISSNIGGKFILNLAHWKFDEDEDLCGYLLKVDQFYSSSRRYAFELNVSQISFSLFLVHSTAEQKQGNSAKTAIYILRINITK